MTKLKFTSKMGVNILPGEKKGLTFFLENKWYQRVMPFISFVLGIRRPFYTVFIRDCLETGDIVGGFWSGFKGLFNILRLQEFR